MGKEVHSSVPEKMPQTFAVQSSVIAVDDVFAGSVTSMKTGFIGFIGIKLESRVNEMFENAVSPRELVNVTVLAGKLQPERRSVTTPPE
jgi:hypothetical protein